MSFKAQLVRLDACHRAIKWVGARSFEQAWSTCERGDWMLWLAGALGFDVKLLTLATCDCARLATPFVPAGELRPLRAIETAEGWALDEGTLDELSTADSDYAAAANRAYDAAYAAYAVYAAGYAYAAAYAAVDASGAAARRSILRACAELVRARIPADAIAALLSEVT